MGKSTDLDNRIFSAIRQNPYITRKELQQLLRTESGSAMPYSTLVKRLQKAKNEGLLRERFEVDDERIRSQKFIILLSTTAPKYVRAQTRDKDQEIPTDDEYDYQMDLCETIDQVFRTKNQYSRRISSGGCDILLGGGEWDIAVTLYSEDADAINRFVTTYLRTRSAVTGSSTLQFRKGSSSPVFGAVAPKVSRPTRPTIAKEAESPSDDESEPRSIMP